MLDLSTKQKQAVINSQARLNFWVGAVRSGKTYSSIIRFLEFIQSMPKGNFAIVGRTASTIKRNLIDVICELVGADARYYSGKLELNLWGKTIYLIAGNDERAEGKLRGITLAGAYVDEVTLLPESFFTMLLSRLSVENAKLFATTNPDSPFHWLKKKYLERASELDLKQFEFFLDDNPSLTENFKNALRNEYKGLWYNRYINGQWVLAEGTIYDFFDENVHTIPYAPIFANEYYVGVDYGTTNPSAFVLVGYSRNSYPNIWVEKEYYYDSREHNRQKTDSEYADDLKKFIEGYPVRGIYLDPSAASFRLECIRNGIRDIFEANNDVLDGIRFVASLFTNGTLKICKSCSSLIKEIGSYVWDQKAQERGLDKPLKQSDHCNDALRYVLFSKFGALLGDRDRMTPERLSELRRQAFYQ